jgi:hypothetical protein
MHYTSSSLFYKKRTFKFGKPIEGLIFSGPSRREVTFNKQKSPSNRDRTDGLGMITSDDYVEKSKFHSRHF